MVGTHSGARSSDSAKKTTKKKDATQKNNVKEVADSETNMHGVRVKGMSFGKGADDQAEDTSFKVIPKRAGKL